MSKKEEQLGQEVAVLFAKVADVIITGAIVRKKFIEAYSTKKEESTTKEPGFAQDDRDGYEKAKASVQAARAAKEHTAL